MNILLHKQTIQGRKISTAINHSTNYTTAKTKTNSLLKRTTEFNKLGMFSVPDMAKRRV